MIAQKKNALPMSRWTQDEELAILSQTGSNGAAELLLSRYRPMVESKARTYYIQGAEHDDVLQEGMVGLVKAMRDFRNGGNSKENEGRAHFRVFAELCVTRQIISALKTAARQKHLLLTGGVSIYQPQEDEDGALLQDCLPDTQSLSLLERFCRRESLFQRMTAALHCLSEMECKVFRAYLQEKPYSQIACELRLTVKTVDNALQRIKTKLNALHFPD